MTQRSTLPCAVAAGWLLVWCFPSTGATAGPESYAALRATALTEFSAAAGRVFRGRCTAAHSETQRIAGGEIAATTYSFEILEWYKGFEPGIEIKFTQVGTPEGGPTDLGARVGLPTYDVDQEYLLFLLPESSAALTSPAGAGEAAFLVSGEELVQIGGRHGLLSLPPEQLADEESRPTLLFLQDVRAMFGMEADR